MNEAGSYRQSNLTAQEQREAEAALYGLEVNNSMTPQPSTFSQDDIERMRAILRAHDAAAGGVVKEFDLNKPAPVPYRYREFPKLVYDHTKRTHKAVHDRAQEQAALEAGFQNEPYPSEVVELALDPEDQNEVNDLESDIRARGRLERARPKAKGAGAVKE